MEAPDDRSYRPRWLRFAPFLGRPPALTRRQWRVLGLVSIVSLFEQYDVVLFSMSLKQVQADLGLSESSLGSLMSLVRSGALFSLPLTLAADRVGRRRMLLVTILGYTLCTGATAFAPNATAFVAFQFLARVFAAAEMGIAIVVIAEEFDVEHRGWGMGALGALHACGAGVAGLAFAFVDVLPYGWRALYAIGLVPLLVVAYLRRTLPETGRFDVHARGRSELRAAPPLAPAIELFRRHPRRIAILALAVVAIEIAMGPAINFAPKFLQDVHGWSPAQVAALTVVGGAFAIIGNSLAGWLSDRRGRRPVAVMFMCGVLVAIFSFYSLSIPFALPALWILLVFTLMGTQVTLGAYGAEMFPTGVRSTASGVREFSKTAGASTGNLLVSALYGVAGSNWGGIVMLCAIGAFAPLIVLLSFPETARRPLEEIAPETEEVATGTQVAAPTGRES
ncbi:MAG TPA: MFS transporter [Myxococcota bacterium]|jgi:putative MFS transporter|nr:MFS transporter [Myxococcota bacterium]